MPRAISITVRSKGPEVFVTTWTRGEAKGRKRIVLSEYALPPDTSMSLPPLTIGGRANGTQFTFQIQRK